MGEVQSESVGKANRGLCYTGHCDCNGSKLETDIQRPVQAWRNASRYAEQQYDMGNVSAGKRSNTVPAAGELSGLHHGEGVL